MKRAPDIFGDMASRPMGVRVGGRDYAFRVQFCLYNRLVEAPCLQRNDSCCGFPLSVEA